MSADMFEDGEVVIAYGGAGPDRLSPEELNLEIRRVWSELISSEQGRAKVAYALGVDPACVNQDAETVPFSSPSDESGVLGVDLAVALQWAAINIVVPILVGLAKDEVKARFVQLWREVIKPAIDGDDDDDKFGHERHLGS